MKALVTGANGFIGANLVRRLLRDGYEVIGLDDFSAANPRQDLPIEVGNVADFWRVDELMNEVEVVFHLAARTMALSTTRQLTDLQTNIGGTLNVLLCAKERGVPVVYSSSSAIYGNGSSPPFKESSPVELLTPYAASKYAAEGYCQVFKSGVRVTVLRLSNVYGPHQSTQNPYCGVIAKLMARSKRGYPLPVYGDGKQTRDFTYIDDAVEALVLASQKGFGEVINIGTGIETSITQLAGLVGGQLEYQPGRDIDLISRRALDNSKAKELLGWQPKVDLQTGLELTRKWGEKA
jgi:UDP-glucose 4-epimerase